MTIGIILAGGRGTRMGPLAAQVSKALLSIGQQPHMIHQINQLKSVGCERVVVVVSQDSAQQIVGVIERAGLTRDVMIAVQKEPKGPVDALSNGLAWAIDREPAYVIMADTYVPSIPTTQGSWIGSAPAPSDRSFCYLNDDLQYTDGPVEESRMVTIGLYRFGDSYAVGKQAYLALSNHKTGELGMSALLNRVVGRELHVQDWLDIGDVMSLASARRKRFISRDHHSLALDEIGVLTKYGSGEDFVKQQRFLETMAYSSGISTETLFPQLHDIVLGESIMMEHIDYPTLSEMFLYWPGLPSTWRDILSHIVENVSSRLWGAPTTITPMQLSEWFERKTFARLRQSGLLNDRIATLLTEVTESKALLSNNTLVAVRGHGDLNFNNILFSLNTADVKLIDPRGDMTVPLLYEAAKLRYSYHAGFSAITHGLTDEHRLLPNRAAEAEAMDEVLVELGFTKRQLTIAEALILLAGAPMHTATEQRVMLERGEMLLEGALNG